MFWTRTKGAALALLTVALAGLGVAMGRGGDEKKGAAPSALSRRRSGGPAAPGRPPAGRRAEARGGRSLKQIAAALRNYNEAHGHLPPPAITDKSGKPLLSWRRPAAVPRAGPLPQAVPAERGVGQPAQQEAAGEDAEGVRRRQPEGGEGHDELPVRRRADGGFHQPPDGAGGMMEAVCDRRAAG